MIQGAERRRVNLLPASNIGGFFNGISQKLPLASLYPTINTGGLRTSARQRNAQVGPITMDLGHLTRLFVQNSA
jgi:hypothetical protein